MSKEENDKDAVSSEENEVDCEDKDDKSKERRTGCGSNDVDCEGR